MYWEYQIYYKTFSGVEYYEIATMVVLCLVFFLSAFAYFCRNPRKVWLNYISIDSNFFENHLIMLNTAKKWSYYWLVGIQQQGIASKQNKEALYDVMYLSGNVHDNDPGCKIFWKPWRFFYPLQRV